LEGGDSNQSSKETSFLCVLFQYSLNRKIRPIKHVTFLKNSHTNNCLTTTKILTLIALIQNHAPATTARHILGLQLVNVSNKTPQTNDKGVLPAWGLGVGLKTIHHKI
jgi:hypothetical protein